MFKSMLRGNATPMKYKMQLEPIQLQYPAGIELEGPVVLVWEKSPRIARSRPVNGSKGTCQWGKGESLSMVMTMYRKKSAAEFMPKESSLKARVLTNKGEKTLGKMNINMGEFCDARNRQFELSLQLDKCVLKCILTTELVPIGATDDSVSTISGISSADARPSVSESYADGFGAKDDESDDVLIKNAFSKKTIDKKPESPKNAVANDDIADLASLEGFEVEEKRSESDDELVPPTAASSVSPTLSTTASESKKPSPPAAPPQSSDELTKIKQELTKTRTELREKETLVKKKHSEITRLQEEITRMTSEHRAKEGSLEKTLADATARNQAEREKALQIVETFKEEKRKQVDNLSSTLAERDKQLATLRSEVDVLNKKYNELQNDTKELETKYAQAQEELEKEKELMQKLHLEEEASKITVQQLQQQIQEYQTREKASQDTKDEADMETNLRHQLANYQNELQKRDQALSKVTLDLTTERDRAVQFESEASRRKDAENRALDKISQLEKEIDALQAKHMADFEKSKEKHVSIAAQLATATATMKQLEASVETHESELNSAQYTIKQLEKSLEETRQERGRSEDKIKDLLATIQGLEAQLKETHDQTNKIEVELTNKISLLEKSLGSMEAEIQEKNTLIQNTNEQLQKALESCKISTTALEQMRAEHDALLKLSEKQTKDSQEKIRVLTHTVQDKEEELRRANDEIGQIRAELQGINVRIEAYDANHASTSESWSHERATILGEKSKMEEELKVLQAALSRERESLVASQQALTTAQAQLGERAQDMTSLENKLKLLQAEKSTLEASLEELQIQMRQSSEELEKEKKKISKDAEKATSKAITIAVEQERSASAKMFENALAKERASWEKQAEKQLLENENTIKSQYTADIFKLNKDLDVEIKARNDAEKRILKLQKDLDEFKTKYESTSAELIETTTAMASAAALATTQRRNLEELQQKAINRADEATQRADDAEVRARKAELQYQEIDKTLAASIKENDLLKKEIEILRSSKQTPRGTHVEEAETMITADHENALREVEFLTLQVSELKREISIAKRGSEDHLALAREAQREREASLRQKEDAEKALQREVEKTKQLQEQNQQYIVALESTDNELRETKLALDNAESELVDAQQEISMAETAFENESAQLTEAHTQIEELSEQLGTSQQTNEQLRQQIRSLQEDLENRKTAVASSGAIATAQRERAEAVSLYEKIRSRNAELKDEVQHIRSELERTEELISRMSKQLSTAEERVEQLEKELSQERERNGETIKNQEETISRLSVENHQLRERHITFESIQSLVATPTSGGWFSRGNSSSNSALNDQVVKRLEFYEQQLMEADETLLNAKTAWQSSTRVLRERNEVLEAKIAELVKEAAESQESRGEEGLELGRVRQKLAKAEKRSEKLSEVMNRLECQLIERKVELSQVQTAKDELEATVRDLQHKLVELTGDSSHITTKYNMQNQMDEPMDSLIHSDDEIEIELSESGL